MVKSKKHSLLLRTSNLELRTFQNLHLATGGRECSYLYKKQVDVIFHAKIDIKNASIDCFV